MCGWMYVCDGVCESVCVCVNDDETEGRRRRPVSVVQCRSVPPSSRARAPNMTGQGRPRRSHPRLPRATTCRACLLTRSSFRLPVPHLGRSCLPCPARSPPTRSHATHLSHAPPRGLAHALKLNCLRAFVHTRHPQPPACTPCPALPCPHPHHPQAHHARAQDRPWVLPSAAEPSLSRYLHHIPNFTPRPWTVHSLLHYIPCYSPRPPLRRRQLLHLRTTKPGCRSSPTSTSPITSTPAVHDSHRLTRSLDVNCT